MSKKSRFRGPFDKEHGKRAEPLWKSAWQNLSLIDWAPLGQLSWKTSLLLTCQILGLLVDTLAADEKNPLLKGDNLMTAFQMHLSLKQFFFLNFLLHFWHLEALLKSVSHYLDHIHWSLPSQLSRKCLCFWHAKSWDCLVTHWLPMKRIRFFIDII